MGHGSLGPMQVARFVHGELPAYGIVDGDELVVLRSDPLFDSWDTTGERVRLDDVRLLSPVIPRSKVVGIGRNYAAHAAEMGNDLPGAARLPQAEHVRHRP